MKCLILLILSIGLIGCQLFSKEQDLGVSMRDLKGYREKVMIAPYDQVWRAGQLAIGRYSLSINNVDTGVMETDFVKGLDGWIAPHTNKLPSPGTKYKITLRMIKGKVANKESFRVILSKKIKLSKDFFSTPEPIESDELEEISILYRIERELTIEQALKRSAKIHSS